LNAEAAECREAPDSPRALARAALACLDLTSLNGDETEADIVRLCERALSPCGPVAAVCVWPRWAALARAQLPSTVAVAAVVNFPAGGSDVPAALREAALAVDGGAQELDLVLPWRALLAGDEAAAARLLAAVRRAAAGLRLKVILETGALPDEAAMQRAATLALAEGADFLKTSTGKTPTGATPQAARVLLRAIAADAQARHRVGFKAAGGLRTVADAAVYIALARQHLGAAAAVPARFRIGASALLDDIEAVLGGRGPATPAVGGY
jgi:deoxyribose-phosphate aldolase